MTLEDTLRRQLDVLTDPVVGGPRLPQALAKGRSRRRMRNAASAAGLAVVATTAVTAAYFAAATNAPPASDQPDRAAAAADPSPPDFVPGSDTDELLQSVVTTRLGSAVADTATDIYPSDWTRNTPLPDGRAADATDWDALYHPNATEWLTVVMGYPDPQEPAGLGSCPAGSADPSGDELLCRRFTGPGGDQALVQESLNLTTGRYQLITAIQRRDGFTVSAISYVQADTLRQSRSLRQLGQEQLLSVAADSSLTFPAPQNPPA